MIRLELVPAKHPGRYMAMLDGRLLCTSSTPLFSAARMLLRAEIDPDTVLEAIHQGSTIVAMRTTVGEAAKWTVHGGDRQPYTLQPYQAFSGSPLERAVKPDGEPQERLEASGRYIGASEATERP